jgi:Fe-S cluster assembly iron-binding protein IscA
MLTITRDAGMAITSLTNQYGMADTAGLRIQARDQSDESGRQAIGLKMAQLADSGDKVVTEDSTGARVFLDEPAASFLDDKVLDAGQTENGEMQFIVRLPEADPDLER